MVVLSLQWLATESEWAAKRLADAAASDHVFPVRRYLDKKEGRRSVFSSVLSMRVDLMQYQFL